MNGNMGYSSNKLYELTNGAYLPENTSYSYDRYLCISNCRMVNESNYDYC